MSLDELHVTGPNTTGTSSMRCWAPGHSATEHLTLSDICETSRDTFNDDVWETSFETIERVFESEALPGESVLLTADTRREVEMLKKIIEDSNVTLKLVTTPTPLPGDLSNPVIQCLQLKNRCSNTRSCSGPAFPGVAPENNMDLHLGSAMLRHTSSTTRKLGRVLACTDQQYEDAELGNHCPSSLYCCTPDLSSNKLEDMVFDHSWSYLGDEGRFPPSLDQYSHNGIDDLINAQTPEWHNSDELLSSSRCSPLEPGCQELGSGTDCYDIAYGVDDLPVSTGDQKLRATRLSASDVTLNFLENSGYFDLPIQVAAARLQVGVTTLKKICRRYAINRWPHRKRSSIDKLIKKTRQFLGGKVTEESTNFPPHDPADLDRRTLA